MTDAVGQLGNKTVFRDWEAAAKASPFGKAVGKDLIIEQKGSRMEAEVIKPLFGDALIVWKGTGIKIRSATTREIDSIKKWLPY